MHESDTLETSSVIAAEEAENAVPGALAEEAAALGEVYPGFDLETELKHPVLGPLLRGEAAPTLRQLYEAVHWEEIGAARSEEAVKAAVAEAVASAVEAAVSSAVADSEARLLGHIRARGQRPAENGTSAVTGARLYPAVERLTRRERAMLAKRAENGEHIRF